jgi:menaquinone-dependent protoporphyrinogen oxidase
VGKIDIGPMIDERMISDIVLATGAREHQMFAGKLDPDNLRLHQKIALKVVRAPTGDFRDWEAIRNWVHSIAGQLAPPVLEVAS